MGTGRGLRAYLAHHFWCVVSVELVEHTSFQTVLAGVSISEQDTATCLRTLSGPGSTWKLMMSHCRSAGVDGGNANPRVRALPMQRVHHRCGPHQATQIRADCHAIAPKAAGEATGNPGCPHSPGQHPADSVSYVSALNCELLYGAAVMVPQMPGASGTVKNCAFYF